MRENDEAQGKTITYAYDNGGNLLCKTEYAYTTGEPGEATDTILYTYGDEEWKDKLTAYDGQTITYDGVGNPLGYRNGMTFTWQQGRRLAGVTLSDGTEISYQYNTEGIRIGKTAGETETTYLVDSSGTIQACRKGEESLLFLYDSTGRREGFTWYTGEENRGTYYYLYNAQGDIIGIVLANDYSRVVTYKYNSWGKLLEVEGSQAGTVGQLNPFRYRGYCYDAETGFYYVSSRYYDPEIGRFINADSQLNIKDGILGYNMFAYCNNNPIMYSDPTGHSIILASIIIGAVIGAVAGGCAGAYVSKKQTGKVNGWAVVVGAVGGGVIGGLIGWGVGAAITAVGTAATGSAATAAAPVVQKVAEKASTALQTYYPPNDGFSGAVQKVTLDIGTMLQRTGSLYGSFVAPAGTPQQMLSLPYDKIGQTTTYLQVQQPIQALGGKVAPWFGQIGGGTQYLLNSPVQQLLTEGVLKIME